jgi:hypothetical protein
LTESQTAGWASLARGSEELARRVGLGKDSEELYQKAIKILQNADETKFLDFVSGRRGARAVLMVWNDNQRLAEMSMTERFLKKAVDGMGGARTYFSQSLLLGLHFRYFDQLEQWRSGLFAANLALILEAERNSGGTRETLMSRVLSHEAELLSADGPANLASAVIASGVSLARHLQSRALLIVDVGRFGTQVRNELFLRRIQLADPLGTDPVLQEVAREDVLAYPEGGGGMFGHRVLEALALAPLPNQLPSDSWLETIDGIAGDPRLRHTDRWRRWWQPVNEEARTAVISWLSAIDLKLFLDAVQEFGANESVDALERLFPGRKRFLEGLLDTGLVKETRLFFGDDVMSFVSKHLGSSLKFKPDRYKSKADTAIIYLNCGNFHIVEGSHNFQMWIYLYDIPELLRDRRRREVTHETLVRAIPALHSDLVVLADGSKAYESVRHQGLWQAPAIQFLHRNGVAIDIQRLLTANDYADLKSRYGIPPVRSAPVREGGN